MQNYVKKDRQRAVSPLQGPSQGKSDRQANAANARVPMQNGQPIQQPRVPTNFPARGHSNPQNSSAALLQPVQHRRPGPGPDIKRDPFDTDAESIDTTVNQSVVQVEDSQQKEHYHQQGQVSESGESSEMEMEGEESESGPEGPEDQYYYNGYELTQEDEDYLNQRGIHHLPYARKLAFLQEAERGQFPTVEGDSYPSTTNGELSEWGGGQDVASNFHDGGGSVSPSPQRVNANHQAARIAASQPPQQQQMQNASVPSHRMPRSSQMFQHGAQIREQSRATAYVSQHGGQHIQQPAAVPAASFNQNQTHNRTKPHPNANLPLHSNPHPSTYVQSSKSQQIPTRQASGPRTQILPNQNTISVEPPAPLKRPSPAPAIQEPAIQKQTSEQAPLEEFEAVSHEDYDQKTLFKMKYGELKNESFDSDPRAPPPVLAAEDLQKPLAERLSLVQKNSDLDQQSQFFRSLPTTEWEDAGDWFLDQFQNIIQRTKQARQKKRKLAQEFETEVEKRHEHVSKKQHQVQQAMDKMKEQGEGLVPRSPRPSKSPRPKRS